jgi:hypothetical protein
VAPEEATHPSFEPIVPAFGRTAARAGTDRCGRTTAAAR